MFTKDDLKTGMFVKLRENRIGMVIKDNIIMNKGGFLRLSAYNKSLCCIFPANNSKFDIIEVRDRGKYGYDFNMFDSMDLKYQEKHFTKSDIKDGDIVITRFPDNINGIEYSYYKLHDMLLPTDYENRVLSFEEYTENLTHKSMNETIVKVYRPTTVEEYNRLDNSALIYERED